MQIANKRYTCRWCGFTSTNIDDFELDFKNNQGFWCGDCDGFTFFDGEKNKEHQMLLLLEQKASSPIECSVPKTSLKKHLSPLRYPGGKSRLIDFLSTKFSASKMDTFVEVFAGGASVGLSLLDAGLIKKLVLNDCDIGVNAFWSQVVYNPAPLIDRIRNEIPTKKSVKTAREKLNAPPYSVPTLDRAYSFLLLNRVCYSGITKAGIMGGEGGSDEAMLCRWNPDTLVKRIEKIYSMSRAIEVRADDGCALVEQYAYWDDKATLFIDPPYVQKGPALYREFFTEEKHKDLAFLLTSLYTEFPCSDIILTYDDCELIRNIYPFADIQVIGRQYSI